MTIGIIISTYNNPEWLEKTLWSYMAQQRKADEIIIADDGSRDDTAQLIERYKECCLYDTYGTRTRDSARPRFSTKHYATPLPTTSSSQTRTAWHVQTSSAGMSTMPVKANSSLAATSSYRCSLVSKSPRMTFSAEGLSNCLGYADRD